jgi:Zn-dependent alcohol dehydrogenase
VKVVASGVCHSDLSVLQAKLPMPPPCILGHEGAGIVEEVGKGVKHLKAGDHVVLAWVQPCGRCHFCVHAKPHLCEAGLQSAMAGEDFVFEKDGMPISRMAGVGSFADHTVVKATAAIKIREDAPLDRACLVGCGVMTGVGAAINTARVQPGEVVAVFGCGGVGLNVIQGAALAGAARIIAVDLVPSKLEMARAFGATDAVNAKDGDPADAIRELTGGLGVDYAFETAGRASLVGVGLQASRNGGTTVCVGAPPVEDALELGPAAVFVITGKRLLGSVLGDCNSLRDIPRLVGLWQAGRLDLEGLVSARRPLSEINQALDDLRASRGIRTVLSLAEA